jgi:Domain of Unknown Function (DUF928)
MTKKIEFWLVSVAFTLLTIASPGLIGISSLMAAPPKETKSPSRANKLIFFFKGGEKTNQPRVNAQGKRRTRIAGSRSCGSDIVALIPRSNQGSTISSSPTFWFYLPPNAFNLEFLQFRLFNPEGKEIWMTQLAPSSQSIQAGLLKVEYQGPPLVDGAYQWKFHYQQANCNNPQILSGYVWKETHPDLALGINPFQRLRIYAKTGIWHELLTELITLRQQQPQDLQLATDLRSLFFESETIKYSLPDDPTKDDLDLMEKIINAQIIYRAQFITIK